MVLKRKLPLSGGRLCAQVFFFRVFTLLSVRVSSRRAQVRCFSVPHARACFVLRGRRLSVSGSRPPPVRSQVFIRLDSGRQITRPQAATHPSLRGLPETAFNTHLLILVSLQNKIFGCFLLVHSRTSRGSEGLATSAELYLQWYNCFLFEFPPFPHATLNETLSRIQCLTFPAVCCLSL